MIIFKEACRAKYMQAFFYCCPDFEEFSELTDVLMRAFCTSEKGGMDGT